MFKKTVLNSVWPLKFIIEIKIREPNISSTPRYQYSPTSKNPAIMEQIAGHKK